MPAKFSGFYLVSLMYTGFRMIDPTMDTGIDLSQEYVRLKGWNSAKDIDPTRRSGRGVTDG